MRSPRSPVLPSYDASVLLSATSAESPVLNCQEAEQFTPSHATMAAQTAKAAVIDSVLLREIMMFVSRESLLGGIRRKLAATTE